MATKAATKKTDSTVKKAAEKIVETEKAVVKAATETATKVAEKKVVVRKKAATAKKAEMTTEVFVQYWGKEVNAAEVSEQVKKIWTDEMKKVYETWRPVCIAADGLPLVEDVGGLHGYTALLRAIHPTEERSYWAEHPEEQRPDNGPYETKQESLAWAKGLGWKDKVRVETLL